MRDDFTEVGDLLVECFQRLENCQAFVIDNERLYATIGQMIEEIKEKMDYIIRKRKGVK